jgi:serine/threonine-protein phosphatase 2B catalytic subunit
VRYEYLSLFCFLTKLSYYSEESERVSELKNVSGSSKLPYGTLALGAEGIKEAINTFEDAYVYCTHPFRTRILYIHRQKLDIENERLPPDLVDAQSEEGKAYISQPTTPSESTSAPPPANGIAAALEDSISKGSVPFLPSPARTSLPVSPTSGKSPFRRGHGRQASLGTTMTSPSTRRRSIESTMSLLKEAADGKEADEEFEELADQVAGKTKNGNSAAKENAAPS